MQPKCRVLLARPAWALGWLFPAFAACGAPAIPSGTLHSDSAGIAIATALEPRWGPGEGWTFRDTPEIEIGSVFGATEYQLHRVTGAVLLSDGDIVVGDRGSGELRRYAPDGVFVSSTAGEGEGPGEHQYLDFIGLIEGDSLVSYDGQLLRIQVFAPDGEFVRSLRIESPWEGFSPGSPLGLSGRHMTMTFDDESEFPEGIVRWPLQRISTVSLADGTVTVLLDVPGPERATRLTDGNPSFLSYEFGKGPRFAAAAGRLAVVDTEAFSMRSISLDDGSTTRILRRNEPLEEVTSVHVEAFVDNNVERSIRSGGLSREEAEARAPFWRDWPMAPTLPALRSIHLDSEGNLWVEPYFGLVVEPKPFEVFSRDGTWLGSVAMPPGLDRGGFPQNAPRLEIGDDYILGVWRDEQDVEYVRLYRLRK